LSADDFVSQLKSTLINIGTEGVMGFLTANVPFFALPVVRQITKIIVGKIISLAVNETELGLYFIHVDQYTKEQSDKFKEAAQKNAEAQANGSEEERRLAEEELINRARDLIRFNR
jgi:hypothetical protein